MASTPAPWSKAAAVVVGFLLGCDPQVTIAVVRADDLDAAFPIDFVRFVFRPAGKDAIEKGPFSVAGIPGGDFAEVPPDTEFSVDVIGCKELDGAACETENTFIARGCAGGFTRGRDDALSITIEMHPANVGNAACPVEDPASDVFVAEGEGEGE
jgi:hypothetical protein